MNQATLLSEVVEENREVRLVEDGIYSVLPDTAHTHQYDKKAAAYDLVIGTRLYNRVMWGTSPSSHRAFARRAVNSDPNGWLLDAGCGSLLFTAQAYAESSRPVIACDQSLDMLRRARARLAKSADYHSGRIVLLQADLSDIPFRPDSFQTILCMNVLHHYAAAESLVLGLKNLLSKNGHIYLTSLVTNNRFIGDHYLDVLHQQGWIVTPRKQGEMKELLQDSLKTAISLWTEGNMAYATTAITA